MKWHVVGLATVLTVSGCIPFVVPAPAPSEPLPYVETDLSFIRPGESTRAELVEVLGEPLIERSSRHLVIYAAVQKTGIQGVLFILPFPVPLGGEARQEPHHLFIWLRDDDIIDRLEVVRGDSGCTSDGLCIEGSTRRESGTDGWYLTEKRIAADLVVVYDTGAASMAARGTTPAVDACHVFICQKGQFKVFAQPTYAGLDDEAPWSMASTVFAFRRLSPGRHELLAGVWRSPGNTRFEFECAGGDTLYFEIKVKLPSMFGDGEFTARIRAMSSERGRQEIDRRALLLSN